MSRIVLTDKMLRAVKPGERRFDLVDALLPGLLAVVHPAGRISFQLRTRIGAKFPKRRVIGKFGVVTTEEARREARSWLELLHRGGSPEAARAAERAAVQAQQAATVAAVIDKLVALRLSKQRRGAEAARTLRNEVLPHWRDRPIADISHRDVRDLIEPIVARGPAYAANVYDSIRALFTFAVERVAVRPAQAQGVGRRAQAAAAGVGGRRVAGAVARRRPAWLPVWAAVSAAGVDRGATE
jgi:hypothetical protein